MSTDTTAINIPSEEVARQAEGALLGYTYQLYQSVLAWLSLGSNEVLHIEFAEDYFRARRRELELVQIKCSIVPALRRASIDESGANGDRPSFAPDWTATEAVRRLGYCQKWLKLLIREC